MIRAEVVADSISPQGIRLLTFKLRYPWFIHGEVMTHRVLSRNASSNRAIPLKKMLEEVRSDDLRAEPVYWGAEQKGMEPGGELPSKFTKGENSYNCIEHAQDQWRQAALAAADHAETLGNIGLHKSLCNRLLMPFTHANVIATGTEWANFFGLRLAKDADPTMRALAEAMWSAMNESTPKALKPDEWHLPFADNSRDWDEMETAEIGEAAIDSTLIKISVARCARVSYESFPTVLPDGTVVPGKRSTVAEDLALYDRLLGGLSDKTKPLHASPAEHQATPDTIHQGNSDDSWLNAHQHGNLDGWRQYRKMLDGEACAPLPEGYRK